MRVLLIGTGRMAFHLGHALKRSGVQLVGIVGRDADKTRRLTEELGCTALAFGDALPEANVRIIAVSDDAITEVAARLPKYTGVTAHTSGAKDWTLIKGHPHRGVLWPIQSFSPGAPADFQRIPVVIDAEDAEARTALRAIATLLSKEVTELHHAKREMLHIAAVFASNFPVMLLMEAERMLEREGLSPSLIHQLWSATTTKASNGAEQALTGPARRGDLRTIRAHLERLNVDPDLRRAYALMSDLILKAYHPGERRTPDDPLAPVNAR